MFSIYLYKTAKILFYKDNLEYVLKNDSNFIENFIFSNSSNNIETIYLDVKFKEWKKLVDQRNSMWNYSSTLKYFSFSMAEFCRENRNKR